MIGTNTPVSKVASGGWSANTADNYVGSSNMYIFDYGNSLVFGAYWAGNVTVAALLKPQEAWNLDSKLDDGLPARGKVIARWDACTKSSSQSDYTGSYALTDNSNRCALHFIKAF